MEGHHANMTNHVKVQTDFEKVLDFVGHFPPGLLFFVMGIRMAWASLKSYMQYTVTKNKQFLNFPTAVPARWLRGIPIEMYIFAFFIGITNPIGYLLNYVQDHPFSSTGMVAMHISLYPPYGFAGLCSLLIFYGYPIPDKTDCLLFAYASANEGILVYSHLDMNWSPIEYRYHLIMSLLAEICALAFLNEILYRQSILAALFRSGGLMLRGLWFMHVALTIYAEISLRIEPWKSHNDINLSTGCSSLYAFFVLILIILMVVSLRFKTKNLTKE